MTSRKKGRKGSSKNLSYESLINEATAALCRDNGRQAIDLLRVAQRRRADGPELPFLLGITNKG